MSLAGDCTKNQFEAIKVACAYHNYLGRRRSIKTDQELDADYSVYHFLRWTNRTYELISAWLSEPVIVESGLWRFYLNSDAFDSNLSLGRFKRACAGALEKLQLQNAVRTSANDLRHYLPEGSTAYTVLRHTSQSGMYQLIDVYAFRPLLRNGSIERHWLSLWVAEVLNRKFDDRKKAVAIGGTGMDMGFQLVYELSGALYGEGTAIKQEWI